MSVLSFFSKTSDRPVEADTPEHRQVFRRMQMGSFVAVTLGYAMYYVCRTSLNVVKKPIMDEGILSASELGVISSALLFSYAIGKFVNGFLADYSNVKRFMIMGLLVSTLANLTVGLLGFMSTGTMAISMSIFYGVFAVMWALNGWAQSMGAPASVVTLSRWFSDKNRGSFYGFWSLSHNLGEFFSFLLVGGLVGLLGWQYGFIGAAVAGTIGVILVAWLLHDSPESQGFPAVTVMTGEAVQQPKAQSVGKAQLAVLKNPYVWVLAFASAFMYVSRYAVNGWGVLFLQEQKGFSIELATQIISINALLGIVGTVGSGWLSDCVFHGNRYVPAVLAGLLEIAGLLLFALGGNMVWINIVAMVLFGIAIGVLICYLGGLMAVDIVAREASGAALGIVGVASYVAAGLQDIASGLLLDANKIQNIETGEVMYNFTPALIFWIASAACSCLLVLLVWRKSRHNNIKS